MDQSRAQAGEIRTRDFGGVVETVNLEEVIGIETDLAKMKVID